ncbi:MAG: peptidase [Mycobacterium sp.]|nr:peptidase [Mycobacterium sp.]
MRRTHRASASRPGPGLWWRACAVPVSLAVLVATPGLAFAEPAPGDPNQIAALITAVANANQKLQDLGAAVQSQQESVNKALVDVQTARDNAATAQQQVDEGQRAVGDANNAIAAAQQRFDTFAAATYMNGPSGSYLTASDPQDIVATATAGQTLAVSSQQVMSNLQRARTEQVNKESAARLAKQKADQAAADAQASQDAAVSALTQAQQSFGEQQAEVNRVAAERNQAQAQLDAARTAWSASASGRPATPEASTTGDRWEQGAQAAGPVAARPADTSEWDTTLPMVPSAFVGGDPIAIVNAVLGISATSAQVTADLGRNFLTKIGILKPTDTGITNGAIPRVYGRQAAEYVIKRAGSQIGVPYSWGGGNAAGPSRGIDSGAGTVGFDCSGLILYAFAGVGIKLPHYSGSQYNLGRQIPSAQMRRGDVIFYGPGGSQHVTLYLGDGQMLEAPYTGSDVHISPVRSSGMTPYVVRYIEY